MRESILKIACRSKYLRSKLLNFFSNLHNLSYKGISKVALFENDGLHPKHEIMKYYNFFKENISKSDNVLDVGCGNGYVANKVAKKARRVIGIDIKESNIELAKSRCSESNLEFIAGDAIIYVFEEKQDVIILSNVLEHIEKRVVFLKKLSEVAPKILIRVPLISRSWIDFYKKTKGQKYKLDNTHYIEYEESEIFQEVKEAGLEVNSYHVRWGEIFIVTKVKK